MKIKKCQLMLNICRLSTTKFMAYRIGELLFELNCVRTKLVQFFHYSNTVQANGSMRETWVERTSPVACMLSDWAFMKYNVHKHVVSVFVKV